MSDYNQSIDFSAKDALATGNPSKKILGADIDTELNLISTAIATKLDSTGSAANLTDVPTGLDLINSFTASAAATFDIETGIDSSLYIGYMLNIVYMYPSTNTADIRMRIKRGGSYQATGYSTILNYINSSAETVLNSPGTAVICWQLTTSSSNNSANALSATLYFTNPHDTTAYMHVNGHGSYVGSGGGTNGILVHGYYGTGGGLQGIRFLASSGNINGLVYFYGIRKT